MTLLTSPRLVVLAAALSLTACAGIAPHGAAPVVQAVRSPLDQFPIPVAETPDEIRLAVHGSGLSSHQREALGAFVARWREAGAETITVQAPSDGPDAPVARDAAERTMNAFIALGVPAARLRLVGYAAGRPGAPILAGYLRLEAQAPDCAKEWDNLVSTRENASYRAFGCAVSSNGAVQVANAHDLVAPAAAGPGDATRREVVMGKYREGRNTSSEADTQAKGVISTAVGNQ